MNGFCLLCFLGFARRIFYPALFTLLYFLILVLLYHSDEAQKKNQDKNEQFNITYDQC
jgi:Na+/H+ antiporter NhaD/arsenite permease-like protein